MGNGPCGSIIRCQCLLSDGKVSDKMGRGIYTIPNKEAIIVFGCLKKLIGIMFGVQVTIISDQG